MSAQKKITVLLAEDHAVVRQSIARLLEIEGMFEVLAHARTGQEAVQLAKSLRPDVILMDIAMPVLNGLEATRHILLHNPAAKILILTAYSDDEYIERLMAAGAVGFLEKQTSAEILTKGICEIARGKTFFSPAIAKKLANSNERKRTRGGISENGSILLTNRETEVLQLVSEGHANKQVAADLGISIKTVEKHRQRLMDKLNIHETAGLTRYALTHGITESSVEVTII